MKKPVDDEDTCFFIQFIFDRLAANRNFDKNINIMGWVEAAGTASRNMICFSKAYSNLSNWHSFYAGRKATIAPNDMWSCSRQCKNARSSVSGAFAGALSFGPWNQSNANATLARISEPKRSLAWRIFLPTSFA